MNEIETVFYKQKNALIGLQEHCLGKVKFGGPLEPYLEDDVRKSTIEIIEAVTYSIIAAVNLVEKIELNSLTLSNSILSDLLGVTDLINYGPQTKESIWYTSRITLCDISYFQMDNCISKIIDTLQCANRGGFNLNLEELHKRLGFLRGDFQSIDTLRTIRNSFHNGGIHSKKSVSFNVNLVTFEFINGKSVDLTHETAANVLKSCIDEMCKIFLHPDVSKIKFIPK